LIANQTDANGKYRYCVTSVKLSFLRFYFAKYVAAYKRESNSNII